MTIQGQHKLQSIFTRNFEFRIRIKKEIEILESKKSIQMPNNFHEIQLWPFANGWLLNKPYENEVTLTGQTPPLKCCQQLEIQ